MSVGERIETLLRAPDPSALEWAHDPAFFADFLQHTQAAVYSDPNSGLVCAEIAYTIAPSNCDRVQAMGLLAQVDRYSGKLEAALGWLRNAAVLARRCHACRLDLRRRRAFVRMDQKLFAAALADANGAIEGYVALGGPGHDLDRNGLAKAYMCRGQVYFEAGRVADSIADVGRCLAITDPAVSAAFYRVAVFNLAWALAHTGRREDLELAEEHLRRARRLFFGVTRRSQERAKLTWLTAMVRRELRKARPARIRDMLEDARRDLLHLGFVQEAAAISADLMKMAFPDRELIRDALERLGEGYERVRASISPELRTALKHVAAAVEAHDIRAVETLKAAIEGLRETCGPQMLACLVSWRPVS